MSLPDGSVDPRQLPGDTPEGSVLSDAQVRNALNVADLTYQALTGKPLPNRQPAKTESRIKFEAGDIFELVIAASQVAYFVISSDLATCSLCGRTGTNMAAAEEHNPLCNVGRLWRAIDRLRITMEGRR